MVGVGSGIRDITEPDYNAVGLSKEVKQRSKSNELDENKAMSNQNANQSAKASRNSKKEMSLSQKERKLGRAEEEASVLDGRRRPFVGVSSGSSEEGG